MASGSSLSTDAFTTLAPTLPSVVVLHGGKSVSSAALRLALDLEDRGFTFTVDGDGLIVAPRERLTDADRAAIREWRDELIRIAAYGWTVEG